MSIPEPDALWGEDGERAQLTGVLRTPGGTRGKEADLAPCSTRHLLCQHDEWLPTGPAGGCGSGAVMSQRARMLLNDPARVSLTHPSVPPTYFRVPPTCRSLEQAEASFLLHFPLIMSHLAGPLNRVYFQAETHCFFLTV